MAGAFGGDDYEDEEELDETEEDIEETEDEKSEEESEDEEDETSDEDEMNAIQKKIFELEEKRLKEKLPKILQKVQSSQLPIIVNPLDKKSYEKAKKHKNLKPQVAAIDLALLAKKAQLASKVMSTVAPALPYIGIGALILIGLLVVVAFVASIMPWLFPDDNLGEAGGSEFGIKGDKFYGVRTIYTDEELAKVGLLEHYSSIIENVRESVQTSTYQISREGDANGDGTVEEGETEKYNVSVKFILPELTVAEGEEFDYSTFVADDFLTNNADLEGYFNLLKAMSEVVYASDNATNAIPTDLNEVLSGIKYFGLNNLLVNTTESNAENDVDDILVNYFANETNYSIIATKQGETEPAGITLTEQEKTSLDLITRIKENVNSTMNGIELIRTEKLFIKDYILESEDDKVSGISKQNYISAIFMPKQDVNITKFSFFLTFAPEGTTMKLVNGSEVEQFDVDNANFATDENSPSTSNFYLNNANVQTGAYTNIDVSKLGALSNGVSLIQIVTNSELSLNYSTYLTLQEGSTEIYTAKTDGVRVDFVKPNAEDTTTFNFSEVETIYK